MACRRVTVEEYNNLPQGQKGFDSESKCECCQQDNVCWWCAGTLNAIPAGVFGVECPPGYSKKSDGNCYYEPKPIPDGSSMDFMQRDNFCYPGDFYLNYAAATQNQCCAGGCCQPGIGCVDGKCGCPSQFCQGPYLEAPGLTREQMCEMSNSGSSPVDSDAGGFCCCTQ